MKFELKKILVLAFTLPTFSKASVELLCMSNDPYPGVLVSISLQEKDDANLEGKQYEGHTKIQGPGAGNKYDSVYVETTEQTEKGFVRSLKSHLKTTAKGETKIELVEVLQGEGGLLLSFKGVFEFGPEPNATQLSLKCKYIQN